MIDLSIGDEGIAVITWNMADRSMNVLNDASMAAFAETVTKVIEDDAVKGVIITSAKKDFIAGADLFAMIQADDAQAIFDMSQGFHKLTRAMETCGKPFVAALNGTALGGGLEIALACHRRIAADNPKAQVGQPEVQVGLLPGGGGTQRLPRMIGARDALQLMVRGRKLSMASAKASGIIDEVVPPEELLDAAKAWLTDKPDATQPWDRGRRRWKLSLPATPWRMPRAGAIIPRSRPS
jgi:3-hydroxyacyl-CoA dehydrogenase/enoyl-CoA hydratase/3-hydroxybutyryl-CoA epimerase